MVRPEARPRTIVGALLSAGTTLALWLPMALPVQAGALGKAEKRSSSPPVVIAHRGASGQRPEHSLAAYRLAARQGADFIEPDLVITRDGQLIARHENELSGTTDVASRPEFAERRTSKRIDGQTVTGWFAEDFSLAEIKTLAVRERIPHLRPGNVAHEAGERIPTLREILIWLKDYRARSGHDLGLYPETKHPAYFRAIGLPLEPPLLALLGEHGWDDRAAPVIVQSFEVGNLRWLAGQTTLRLVQLFGPPWMSPPDLAAQAEPPTYAAMANAEGLREIARYAHGIGPPKTSVIARDAGDRSGTPTGLLARAHAVGLVVHPYTFRNENVFLPRDLQRADQPHGNAAAEYRQFFELGVDGVFSDYPETAVEAREKRRPTTRPWSGASRP